ncbi:MAG: type II CAAX endopeptidase family protein [Burkholderiales bacterium]
MTSLDRRPAFWIAYAVLSAIALVVALRVFPQAMPIVHLDITMTRQQALDDARALATKLKLAPEDARSAVVFNEDGTAQSYVELEGGGKDAFAALVAGKAYAPYWWEVRLFKLGVVDETTIRFRPDGAPNGFSRRVAETYVHDEAEKALPPEAALARAKERAQADWGIDFARYKLLDQSQQTQPSGRVDHNFVFELDDTSLGEARIRLSLDVSGDELTEVEPFVHVPESFVRRYQEMRSANNAIAGVASVVAGILYGLVGVIVGGLLLLRAHALELLRSLVAGLVVGGLGAAAMLANAQAAWFAFPTTQTESNFWIGQVGRAAVVFVLGGLALGLVFAAAEGLTRRAFPHHPQLWRVWSREAAPTPSIAGRTAGGYLFVPIELAFVALFYALTNRYLGWWQPSEQLTDPNILASAVPALSPISMALQAGMMEECLFRGIPLALGAIVGARYGRRTLGIAIAFVLQAVVFGAAHANYPGFPSYSRLVELIVPSLAWALIFLRYGLVPTMILHALFDLVLMSIPLFLVDARFATMQRGLVIAAGALPILVVLLARWRAGAWIPFPEALRNGGWRRAGVVAVEAVETRAVAPAPLDHRASAFLRWLPGLGLAGAVAWIAFTPLRADVPPLAIDRGEAIAVAEGALAARGAQPGSDWERMAVPRSAMDEGAQRLWHGFVWREAGPQAYRALVGNALAPPLWDVRVARFTGDVAERAEEWRVTVTGDGKVRQVVHRLPEGRKGASLSRAEAQALAEKTLRGEMGVDPAGLLLRGADEGTRKDRKDWVFSYADPRLNVGPSAEARLQVAIAGDEVASAGRSMYVPESWQRAETERDAQRKNVRIVALGIVALASLASLVLAAIAWARGRSDRRALALASALMLAMMALATLNNWPVQAFGLKTTEPVANQVAMSLLAAAGGALFFALLVGLLAGVGVHYARLQPAAPGDAATWLPPWARGACAALATAGIAAALAATVPASMPAWPDLSQEGAWSRWAAAAIAGFAFVPALAVTLYLLSLFDRLTSGWARRVPMIAAILVVLGMSIAMASGKDLVGAGARGAIEGFTAFAFAWLLLRHDLRTVPAFVATGLMLEAAHGAALDGTAASWTAFGITAAVACLLAWLATRVLQSTQAARPA